MLLHLGKRQIMDLSLETLKMLGYAVLADLFFYV